MTPPSVSMSAARNVRSDCIGTRRRVGAGRGVGERDVVGAVGRGNSVIGGRGSRAATSRQAKSGDRGNGHEGRVQKALHVWTPHSRGRVWPLLPRAFPGRLGFSPARLIAIVSGGIGSHLSCADPHPRKSAKGLGLSPSAIHYRSHRAVSIITAVAKPTAEPERPSALAANGPVARRASRLVQSASNRRNS